MKSNHAIIITKTAVALVAFALLSCTPRSPVSPTASEQAALSASLHITQKHYSAANLDSLVLVVADDRTKETVVRRKIILKGVKAQEKINVPAEKNLLVSVTGYRESTAVLYGSKTVMPLNKGASADVHITLDFLVPTIILSPPDAAAQNGDTVSVYLEARNVIELAAFGCLVQFDPSVLQVKELGRTDDFLRRNRGTVTQMAFAEDNVNGTVRVVLGIFPAGAAVSGSGRIGRIVFRCTRPDTTEISVHVDNRTDSDLGLFNKNADLMYSVGLGCRLIVK